MPSDNGISQVLPASSYTCDYAKFNCAECLASVPICACSSGAVDYRQLSGFAVGTTAGWPSAVPDFERPERRAADADRRYAAFADGLWEDGRWMEAGRSGGHRRAGGWVSGAV